MINKKMIIWHYCPQRYIIDNNTSSKSPQNINFIFNQQKEKGEKEEWEEQEDIIDEEEDDDIRGSEIHFWMGHANFEITKEMQQKFDKYVGVEFCRILTRYCFIISPGMLFDFADIRREIESDFCEKINHEDVINILKSKYRYWMIYINGKGEIDYICSNSEKDDRFIEDSAYFKLSLKKNGGQIIEGD